MLLAIAGSIKRTLAASAAQQLVDGTPQALLIGLFQDRLYYETERSRFEAFAAAGVTVLAGFPGAEAGAVSPVLLDSSGRRDLENAWVLVALSSTFAAVLMGRDERGLSSAPTLEAGRLFLTASSFRRPDAAAAARAALAPLRQRLPEAFLSRAESIVTRAEAHELSVAEEQLVFALEQIESRLAIRAPQLGSPRLEERDLLTGLPNCSYLERFLGQASSASFVALLIDVDDLGQVNDVFGRQVGDAALQRLANGLSEECAEGELLVHLGEDDFLLLASPRRAESPLEFAERVVAWVRALRFATPLEGSSLTASVGVAVVEGGSVPLDALRQAMANAKDHGKNSARMADSA